MAKGALRRVWYDVTEDGAFGLMPTEGPPYVYNAFPCVRYHATLEPRLIRNKTQLEKLSKEWSEKPIRPQDCDRREPVEE